MKAESSVGRSARRFAALVTLAVVATACVTSDTGGGANTQAGGVVTPRVAKEPTKPVTISFASWVGESPQMKGFAEKFQKLHPNITIQFANVPAERATDKLVTQVAGGQPSRRRLHGPERRRGLRLAPHASEPRQLHRREQGHPDG